MRDFEKLANTAKLLHWNMRTDWSGYDFSEKSVMYEERVPKLEFLVDVDVLVDEVTYRTDGDEEKYTREVQVRYEGDNFVFFVTTNVKSKTVRAYSLKVYTPAGDGKGGLYLLFKEESI